MEYFLDELCKEISDEKLEEYGKTLLDDDAEETGEEVAKNVKG